jgi:hypothetical protein
MPKINDDDLQKLKAAHPRGILTRLVGPEEAEDDTCDEYVFRVPTRADYNGYKVHQKKSLLGQAAPDAAASLARLCLLYPSKEDFDALREKAPAIVEDLGEDLVEAAAAGLSVREGKR